MIRKYQDLMTYFLKHSFKEIPVIMENRFNKLLLKKDLLKFIHKMGSLEKNVDRQLLDILTFLKANEIEFFFEKLLRIKEDQQKKIPILYFDNLIEIKLLLIKDFFYQYKEIKTLMEDNFFNFYQQEESAIFIMNNQNQIIYKNPEFEKIEESFLPIKKKLTTSQQLEKLLLQIKKNLKTKFYKKKIANKIFYFKVQEFNIQEGIVFQFTFIKNRK